MGRAACTEPQCLYKGALYLYLHLLIDKQYATPYVRLNDKTVGRTRLDKSQRIISLLYATVKVMIYSF